MSTAEPVVILGDHQIARSVLIECGTRAASALADAGVREGDAVALLLQNDPVYFELLHAAALLGAYVVPLNWHSSAEEIRYILSDCCPIALIGHRSLLDNVGSVIPDAVATFALPDPGRDATADTGTWRWRCWAAFRDGFPAWDAPARAPRGTMIYTSGTTGRPKGVRRQPMTAEQVAQNAALLRQIYGIAPGMRAFVCGPLYHASPGAFARQAFQHAVLTVLQHGFDPEELLRTIAQHRITHLTMVPTMFVRLLRLCEEARCRYDVSSIKWVTHTGAACPPEVKRQMIAWWGPVIHETYGATETGPAIGCDSEEWLAHPGTVGRAMSGTTVRIYDEQGRVLGVGEIGEIYLRTEAYSDFTYHNRADQRREIDRDGLVTCGDVGYLDADGYLFICDRKRDMVISGGVNIYPAEIESVLVNCPGVRDCAVFGVPDEEFGECLVAAVESDDDGQITPATAAAFLQRHIARFKIPKRFLMLDALPREASGKLLKRKLRDAYLQGAVSVDQR
ncbi:AMP-binding protein [Rhodopseudomonas palustris]|uniref:AMP-binding protein n=1 Tax=Rhodopseudomonas palustris TaxID=1076 RepID=UPI002ACE0A27|nr:AMP-binding protein [Rhodopseudomonas palustris]WQH00548.1 AMP-binding protein [Rhodopseudomonas palustris]